MQGLHEPEVQPGQGLVKRAGILGRKPVSAQPQEVSDVQRQNQGFYIGALEGQKFALLMNALSDGVW